MFRTRCRCLCGQRSGCCGNPKCRGHGRNIRRSVIGTVPEMDSVDDEEADVEREDVDVCALGVLRRSVDGKTWIARAVWRNVKVCARSTACKCAVVGAVNVGIEICVYFCSASWPGTECTSVSNHLHSMSTAASDLRFCLFL